MLLMMNASFSYTVNLPKLTFVLFQISRNFSASSSFMGPLVAQVVKNLPAMQETRFDPWVGKFP